MEIHVTQGAIQEVPSELIVVNLFQGVTAPGGAEAAIVDLWRQDGAPAPCR